MKFKENNRPIYLQIAESICDGVMNGSFREGQRIPSVREYASTVAVNPNTVMRSYEHLSQKGVITNRRGIGFFVTDDAREIILNSRRESLLGDEIDDFFHQLSLMQVSPSELAGRYADYLERMSQK